MATSWLFASVDKELALEAHNLAMAHWLVELHQHDRPAHDTVIAKLKQHGVPLVTRYYLREVCQ